MTKKIKAVQHKICLYWSQERGECTLTKRGLFIPTQDHIEIYCTSSQFYKCHHYISGRELIEQEKLDYSQSYGDNRRFFQRKEGRYSVKLESCDSSGVPTGNFHTEAQTIDLSAGGMRIETPSEIPQSSLIAFRFGAEFFIPDFAGFGEIRWSDNNGSQKFLSGLSFVENRVKRAIGAHIGFV